MNTIIIIHIIIIIIIEVTVISYSSNSAGRWESTPPQTLRTLHGQEASRPRSSRGGYITDSNM